MLLRIKPEDNSHHRHWFQYAGTSVQLKGGKRGETPTFPSLDLGLHVPFSCAAESAAFLEDKICLNSWRQIMFGTLLLPPELLNKACLFQIHQKG